MGIVCEQRGCFKENRNRKDMFIQCQKDTVEISETHNDERMIREFETQNIFKLRACVNGWQNTDSKTKIISATNDRKLWSDIIVQVLKRYSA